VREAERIYYNERAREFDDWYLGLGQHELTSRPGWTEELQALQDLIASWRFLAPLDIACGTGFLTRNFTHAVTGIDQSHAMLTIARTVVRPGKFVQGDALKLPFRAQQFDGALIAHFYGHLLADDRAAFLSEARRVARDLIFIDSALRPGVAAESIQERVLKNGSRHRVYKRYFTPEMLSGETGATEILHAGTWFVAALRRGMAGR
jgi:ubiquinone/menaquinone biosynthesis C-methylase UbiE